MKKLLITVAAVMLSLAATYGQGQVNFATRITSKGINARVFNPDGTTPAIGTSGAMAGLYLVTGGVVGSAPIAGSVTPFQSPPSLFTGYVTPVTVTIPGVAEGANATLLFRAWVGDSFEGATIKGEMTAPFTVATGGGVNPAADLVGIQGFTMVPEPSTIALGVLGAAALLLRRRK